MWWKLPTGWKQGNLFLKNSYKYKWHAVRQGACSTPRLLASSYLHVFLGKYKGFLYSMIRWWSANSSEYYSVWASHNSHWKPCLDAHVLISIHMCSNGLECNWTKFHSNPLKHMWIEVDIHASKHDQNECLDSFGIIIHWRIRRSLQVELYMKVVGTY